MRAERAEDGKNRPDLIAGYLEALSAQLPTRIVEELADGLGETHEAYLDQGLGPGPAACAAIAEFGEPSMIVASFLRVSPARITARRLLVIGPGVGLCWAAALLTSRGWDWPVPLLARVLFGLVLTTTIGLLATAALSPAYRLVTRAGLAACACTAAIDIAMISGVILTAPAITWLTVTALTASGARVFLTTRSLRLDRSG